ncbi:hypothetical protein [Streptosporangium canum]|uniref:hypothetical protein n=1 Tax=Streptosporangium canum TaxID=324952 RepID=UPI0037970733
MPEPRERADLPYADHLEAFSGRLAPQGDYDTVAFEGNEFEEAEASNARFIECAFSSVTFTGGHYPRARFSDVWVHTVRWVGSELTESPPWPQARAAARVEEGAWGLSVGSPAPAGYVD